LSEKTGFHWEPPPKRLAWHADLRGWLLDWIGKSDGDQMTWFFFLLYNLWQARNDARESKVMRNPSVIVAQTLAGASEWKDIHSRSPGIKNRVVERWQRPEGGFLKVNVDGAFRHAENNGGGGAVVRNSHGEFCAGASRFFPHVVDAEGAELLACRLGLGLAKDLGARKIILEMDSAGAVAKIQREDRDRSLHGQLVEEIKGLLSGFEDKVIKAVRRSANDVAHEFAKLGCVNKCNRCWVEVPPTGISDLIVSDAMVI
jgi:ribonuclease HI